MNNNLKIKVDRTHFNSNYTVTGLEKDVKNWCERFLQNYHPAGYGTCCRFANNNNDGTVTYLAYRYNSCD